jgi:hypothetical protein
MIARVALLSFLAWCVLAVPQAEAQTDSQRKLDALFGTTSTRTSIHKRFTAAQRTRIADELRLGEDRAAKEAQRRAKGNTSREIDLRRTLEDRAHAAVGKKYRLTDKEVSIVIEEANQAAMKRHR